MPLERNKSAYDKYGNYISQKIKNIYPSATFTRVGSRAKDSFTRRSDLDYQFRIQGKGKSDREEVYAEIKNKLGGYIVEPNGEKINIRIGGEKNVINFQPERGGKISFALMD